MIDHERERIEITCALDLFDGLIVAADTRQIDRAALARNRVTGVKVDGRIELFARPSPVPIVERPNEAKTRVGLGEITVKLYSPQRGGLRLGPNLRRRNLPAKSGQRKGVSEAIIWMPELAPVARPA